MRPLSSQTPLEARGEDEGKLQNPIATTPAKRAVTEKVIRYQHIIRAKTKPNQNLSSEDPTVGSYDPNAVLRRLRHPGIVHRCPFGFSIWLGIYGHVASVSPEEAPVPLHCGA